jgi:transposase-like protein
MYLLERKGRAVAKVVPDVQKTTLHAEVHRHVERGSSVFTDQWAAYRGLEAHFEHQTVDHVKGYVDGAAHTNGVENFWSLFKRILKGTYIHVNPEHLFRYVDEQAYRFNGRKGNDSDRFTQATQSVAGRRLTYRQLTGKQSYSSWPLPRSRSA